MRTIIFLLGIAGMAGWHQTYEPQNAATPVQQQTGSELAIEQESGSNPLENRSFAMVGINDCHVQIGERQPSGRYGVELTQACARASVGSAQSLEADPTGGLSFLDDQGSQLAVFGEDEIDGYIQLWPSHEAFTLVISQ